MIAREQKVFGSVPKPEGGTLNFLHYTFKSDGRTQGVVQHRYRTTSIAKGARRKAIVTFVHRLPIAAVDQDHQRRR